VPVTSVDIFPTIVKATGGKLPKELEIDGVDLRPVLAGTGNLDRTAIYWHFPHYRHAPGPYSIIRDGDWKLIKWYEGGFALFDLKNDQGEKRNIAATMPEKTKSLNAKLMAHLKGVGAKIPVSKGTE
jgi:arylsulfatase A-like enzyme